MKKVILSFCFVLFLLGLVACTMEPSNQNSQKEDQNDIVDPTEEITYLTVTEAYNMALSVGSEGTAERQYVMGIVKNISNANYGEMYITDGTTDLYVYGVYSDNGLLHFNEMANKPASGDEVYLYGILKLYNDKPEMGASWLQRFVSHQGEIDYSSYNEMSILDARNSEVDSKVTVEGVVAKITYANGMNPNGLFLVDDTSSIYVYSNEIAGGVSVGQKIKVAGTKTLYILESEQAPAAIHGYQGSIQLQDAALISKAEGTYEFNKEWIETTTVKQILETPMSNNITTKIFKVNAIVKEVPGVGFTNFYVNDLDDETGSYCYSLCNGGDYTYLRPFDGKICEVYLAAINCKATTSGTIYRFVPILVSEATDFSMSDEEIAEFALEYYAKAQFLAEYNSDPKLEVATSFSNEVIPFSGVSVSYTSLNPDLVSFDNEDGKLVMHLAEANENAKIKMEATYNGVTVQKEVEIFINFKTISDTMTVAEVIAAEDGTEVVVKGIVMSGTVNQTGFYLNDGTGVIAVLTTSDILATIALGNEIVIKGVKNHKTTKPDTMVGQIYIQDATVEANLLGNHEYSETPFITNLSFQEIVAKLNDLMVDQTTNVFVATCYINKVEGSYSTNFYLSSTPSGQDIYLYAGSGSQYSIYNEMVGKEVTVAFAFVNWNSKSPYRACIVYATDGETLILNNYNFR